MAQDSKRLEDDFAAAQKSYNEVKNAEVLKDTKELTDLNTNTTSRCQNGTHRSFRYILKDTMRLIPTARLLSSQPWE